MSKWLIVNLWINYQVWVVAQILMTSQLSTLSRMWTKRSRVLFAGKSADVITMPEDILRVNISRLSLSMNAWLVVLITKLWMPCPVTTHSITEINEWIKLDSFLTGLSGDGNFDDLVAQYIVKNGNKTYSCSICEKVSRDLTDAKRHLESIHFPSESGYACQSCESYFKTFQALSKHNLRYHRNKWFCFLFSQDQDQIKVTKVSFVFIGLSTFDDLASQYIAKNGNKYCCSLCGKVSRDLTDAKRHLESIHFPSDGGYECQICNSNFKTWNALSCHNSKYHRNK